MLYVCRSYVRMFVLDVCECVSAVFPFILDVGLVDVPYLPGSQRRKVTQNFSSTFLLRCLPRFFARKGFSRSFPLSTEFLCNDAVNESIILHLLGFFFFVCVSKILVGVTAPGFELTSQRQKASRLPTEPPGCMCL